MYNDVSELLGKTLSHLKREEYEGNDALIFITTEGEVYRMTHIQDCCENVYIDDIDGDLEDLVGSPLTQAVEVSSDQLDLRSKKYGPADDCYEDESYTWTFYKFATIKGYVTIRWYGSSNGYYSESVNFDKIA